MRRKLKIQKDTFSSRDKSRTEGPRDTKPMSIPTHLGTSFQTRPILSQSDDQKWSNSTQNLKS